MEFEFKVTSLKAWFTVEIGQPIFLWSPKSIDPELLRRASIALKKKRTKFIDGSRYISTWNPWNHRRLRKLLNQKNIQIGLPFVTEKLANYIDCKLCGFGRCQRVLLEMALFSRDDYVVIFSTSGCDPKGTEILLEYASILSERCYVVHIESPSSIPASVPSGWTEVHLEILGGGPKKPQTLE